MCGIWGLVGETDSAVAAACLATLAHRGPDGEGVWQGPGVTLGHRRLAILDLSPAGAQPMASPCGRFHLVYNGEIYNFVELRAELEGRGHRFRGDGDSEVLLAAFVEWGDACVDRLRGMWAFAVWDARDRRLFLCRDRFGVKPLYYAHTARGFAFASEMKALFPLLARVEAVEALVRDGARLFTYEATEECVIRGIRRFPAGHAGWWDGCTLLPRRWWCTLDHLETPPARYAAQVEEFRARFAEACRLRLRSDVTIGTALSGGLDSSAVIATMAGQHDARAAADWQHAFVASFPGSPIDEVACARQVTDHLGLPATVLEIDPGVAVAQLERYTYLCEDLYLTSPIPFILTYGAMRARGVTVSLDGHGADELFGGYPFCMLNALRDAGPRPALIRDVLAAYYASHRAGTPEFAALPPRAVFWLNWWARHLLRQVRGRERGLSPDETHPAWREMDYFTRMQYVFTHHTILPTLLRNYDRYSMANGVEIRMPFMDHRVISFAFSLPWTAKLRGGFSKRIIRDAVAPLLPAAIVWRKDKIGFNSPMTQWLRGPLRVYFQDMLASTALQQCPLIDPARARAALEAVWRAAEPTFAMGEAAWTAVAPFLWEQAVVKGRGRPAPVALG